MGSQILWKEKKKLLLKYSSSISFLLFWMLKSYPSLHVCSQSSSLSQGSQCHWLEEKCLVSHLSILEKGDTAHVLHPDLQGYKQALLCLELMELMVTDTLIPWQTGHTPQSQTHKREKWRWEAFTLPSDCSVCSAAQHLSRISVCIQAWLGELRSATSQLTTAQLQHPSLYKAHCAYNKAMF